jgi:hypothetical protein
MGLGPLFSTNGKSHWDQLLTAIRDVGIAVVLEDEDSKTGFRSYEFRRGWGLIHGSIFDECEVRFAFGHPTNPLLWWADSALLRSITKLLETNGARLKCPQSPRSDKI